MLISVDPEDMATMLSDARKRCGLHPSADLTFFSWPQTWPSTACGFPGIGGAAMTTAQTFLFLLRADSGGWVALIYHNCRFAYRILNFDAEEFLQLFGEFPGKRDLQRNPKGYNMEWKIEYE